MFDLETAIAEWRREMLAAGIRAPAPLGELESHLRDAIQRQLSLGQSEPEAFQSAVGEIGPARAVRAEFEKVEESQAARQWKWMQILMVAPMMALSAFMGGMMLFQKGVFSMMDPGERLSGLAAAAALPALVWGGRMACALLPGIGAKRVRDALACTGGGLVLAWYGVLCYGVMPRFEVGMGPLMVRIMWGMLVPGGAVIGLVWGIETAARRRGPAAGRTESE